MEESQDGFRGFGEDFEGFPKRLPDDCVEYSVFIIDAKLYSQRERLSRLERVRKEASKLIGSLLKDYIWQRDSFDLKVENKNGLMYLHGVTNYGDSVEDEWLIVYILRELSKDFPDLWIKVVDTDGEFLLIEAANALPKWLNPEIADNRVWIHHNKLHIIPIAASQSSSSVIPLPQPLSLDEALEVITSSSNATINSPMIEEEAFYRIRDYPSQITASLHRALVTIPRKLAYILHQLPASIAPATEAFYLRDPISLKPLQADPSKLVFRPIDLVTVSVRFTKVLYAQLKAQQFSPPTAWKDTISQTEQNAGHDISNANQYSQHELGMKVTSGFEMLVTDPKNGDDRRVREIMILLEDLTADEISTLPSDTEIASWPDSKRADDEKWLDINFEDFENELQGKNKAKKAGIPGAFGPEAPPGFGDAKTQSDLKKMVERFEAFLNDDEAGLDGAEIDDMDVDDDEDEEDSENSEDEDKDLSFDEEEFAKMMREMMGMPSAEYMAGVPSSEGTGKRKKIEEIDTDDEGDGEGEESEIRAVMERMEAELNEAGALNLDPTPSKLAALKPKGRGKLPVNHESEEESSDDEADIDFNLAKNLLESFKSQGGMAGPGGNMLGMMGMQLPRDEDDKKGGPQ